MMSLFPRNNYLSVQGILFLVCIILFGSCNSTRFVPKGKYLLNRISIKVDDNDLKRDELKAHIRQKENLRILGLFKFHLGIYNLSSAKKENDWLKRIGEAPVLYDEFQTQRSLDQLRIYLKNKGYYNAVVNDSLVITEDSEKLKLIFNIQAKEPYRIRNYMYSIKDMNLRDVILKDSINGLLKTNAIFDVDVLNAERQRITGYLKNKGYYKFSEEFVSFLADTNFYNNRVDLTVQIDDALLNNADEEVVAHQKYKIRNYKINPTFRTADLTGNQPEQKLDTLIRDDYIFTYSGKLKYRPVLFSNLNRMKDSVYYSLQNAEKTYRALNRLKQFRLINIGFTETDSLTSDSIPLLDCAMQLSPLPRQNFSAEVEGTNSSGNLGVAGNLNYQHRNVFGGAEVFDLQLRGARERQALLNNNYNTREFGFESSLTIPKFLSFIKGKRMFSFQIPETKLTAGFNYQSRPDYIRTITNLKFSYNWKTSSYHSHTLNLVDLNYVHLYQFNSDFINSIEDLFIKSSFTDHLIFASSYSWMYNTQNINKREDYTYYKVNLESAGNLLGLYSGLINKNKTSVLDSVTNQISSYYEILNTRFAQYLKGDFEYRYGHMIDKYNSLVARGFVGIGLPYGNFSVLPFEKKYFTGGANGIRAWQVRSLGPGTYKAPTGVYPNQSSDIKLEANLEYRFKLIWRMEGALFVDAGNIWAINYKDNREGAVFKVNEFYKQIAVGSGFGLRFDFTYFLFRLDLGMKMRDPSLPAGRRFIPGSYKITGDHFNLSFAIGYPF
ncbi:MAG TPA: BamA/TamA family outer membrane protein [Prolixibacteraceae bacterium]|nr:BamA/TamA family outer membrane protein [Prolixibacteraceae bacterium]